MRSPRLRQLPSFRRFRHIFDASRDVSARLRHQSTTAGEGFWKSHLYLPNWKANQTVSVLTPHFEFDPSPDGLEIMRRTLECRTMSPVDLNSIARQWREREDLQTKKSQVEASREAIVQSIQQKAMSGVKDKALEQLYDEGRRLRILNKQLTHDLDQLEQSLLPKLLQLPNVLHSDTPLQTPRVLRQHFDIPRLEFPPISHVDIGQRTSTFCLRSVGPAAYYLQGRGALLELATLDYFADRLTHAGFTRFSNPDFCKPLVIEGCGLDFSDPNVTYQLENRNEDDNASKLGLTEFHLLGGASFPIFCAYHVKTRVNRDDLPLQYFTAGRQYRPCSNKSENLFSVSQKSVVNFFVTMTRNDNEVYQEALDMLEAAFLNLKLHFRIVEIPACGLLPSEDRRADLEMWSFSKQSYQRVASVSSVSDFVSKRLRMFYMDDGLHYLHVVHGTAVSFPEFLACLMENTQVQDGNFKIPNHLTNFLSVYE